MDMWIDHVEQHDDYEQVEDSIECVVRNQKGTGNGRSKGQNESHGGKGKPAGAVTSREHPVEDVSGAMRRDTEQTSATRRQRISRVKARENIHQFEEDSHERRVQF